MEQVGLGNTKTKPYVEKGRKWCFTLNNWTDEEYNQLILDFGTKAQYILGKEMGEEGTPHIQGYLEFKNPISFSSMKKKIPRAHLEKSRGSTRQNYDYCSKDGDFETNIDFRTFKDKLKEQCLELYKNVEWKPWQLDVMNLVNDSRAINWYWDKEGNIGKSFLCKYLALTRDVIVCEGKKADVFNQVNCMLEAERIPEVIICDIPRSTIDYINYGALEQLKGGMLYSGKYEGGMCLFPQPLVICFANEPPDESKMSEDRWNVIRIESDE